MTTRYFYHPESDSAFVDFQHPTDGLSHEITEDEFDAILARQKGEGSVSITISRIYAIDGVETNIAATADNAQAGLRLVERAAEELGAAPNALPLVSDKPKNKGGRPKKTSEPEVTTDAPGAPALPAGVATAFEPPVATPPMPYYEPPQEPQLPFPPAAAPAAPSVSVGFTNDPQVMPQPTQVGLAPPAGPPVFAPPPPPPPAVAVDPITALRNEALGAQKAILDLVGAKNPGWLDSISQSLNGILGAYGGNINVMNKDQLEGLITQLRAYDGQIKAHLGA